jgi:hypothetical protein
MASGLSSAAAIGEPRSPPPSWHATAPNRTIAIAPPAAITTAAHDAPIDPALTDALEDPRERPHVLKFEDQIVQFMRSGSKQLDFPPLSSFHRLVLHRLAQRFHLEHMAVDQPAPPSGYGSYPDPSVYKYVGPRAPTYLRINGARTHTLFGLLRELSHAAAACIWRSVALAGRSC